MGCAFAAFAGGSERSMFFCFQSKCTRLPQSVAVVRAVAGQLPCGVFSGTATYCWRSRITRLDVARRERLLSPFQSTANVALYRVQHMFTNDFALMRADASANCSILWLSGGVNCPSLGLMSSSVAQLHSKTQ